MLKPNQKSLLEVVVSRNDLDALPEHIVKIVLTDNDVSLDPKKKLYKYGLDSELDIGNTKIRISPAENSVYIGKETFYISGLVHLTINKGEIQRQSYSTVQKFLDRYRQHLEKQHFKTKQKDREREEYYRRKNKE